MIACVKRAGTNILLKQSIPFLFYDIAVTLTINLKQSGKERRGQKSVSEGIIKKSTLGQSHSWSEFKSPCPLTHSHLAQKQNDGCLYLAYH